MASGLCELLNLLFSYVVNILTCFSFSERIQGDSWLLVWYEIKLSCCHSHRTEMWSWKRFLCAMINKFRSTLLIVKFSSLNQRLVLSSLIFWKSFYVETWMQILLTSFLIRNFRAHYNLTNCFESLGWNQVSLFIKYFSLGICFTL